MRSLIRPAVMVAVCCAIMIRFPAISSADTLQLTGVGGTSAGGVYTGVYFLTDNGKSMLAFCDDFDTHTWIGESWTASAHSLKDLVDLKFNGANDPGALGSDFLKDYQAAIYLGQLLADTPSSDPQRINDLSFAIWGIFSATARSNSAYDAAAAEFDQIALTRNYGPNEYSSWVIWTPKPADLSQEFIAQPTPEPSGLLLLATGLFGLAFLARRHARLSR